MSSIANSPSLRITVTFFLTGAACSPVLANWTPPKLIVEGCAVIVMAKAPLPGYAKTRLIPALGEAHAGLELKAHTGALFLVRVDAIPPLGGDVLHTEKGTQRS